MRQEDGGGCFSLRNSSWPEHLDHIKLLIKLDTRKEHGVMSDWLKINVSVDKSGGCKSPSEVIKQLKINIKIKRNNLITIAAME